MDRRRVPGPCQGGPPMTRANPTNLPPNGRPGARAKGKRRTKAEIGMLGDALYRIVEEAQPVTIRHAFYRMVGEGLIAKSENEYANVVGRLLLKMRREGRI